MKDEMQENVFSEEVERRKGRERSKRFWEKESPDTVEANRLQWSFYRNAGKLQIQRFFGFDKRQYITLDRRALTLAMLDLLKEFINICEEKEGR